jgi:hypothetical protein
MIEDANEDATGNHIATRLAILFVPLVVTTRLVERWLSSPTAWGCSMFAWMLLIYWLPARANLSFRRWLVIAGASSTAAFCLAKLLPDMFR